jgi:hypothetical protein
MGFPDEVKLGRLKSSINTQIVREGNVRERNEPVLSTHLLSGLVVPLFNNGFCRIVLAPKPQIYVGAMENMHHDEANSKKHMYSHWKWRCIFKAQYIPTYSSHLMPSFTFTYTYLGHFAIIYNIFNIRGWDF